MERKDFDEMVSLQKRLDELQDKLNEKGKIVTNELARLHRVETNGSSDNDPQYATEFTLGAFDGEASASRVYWHGEETWRYVGYQEHGGSFHIKWLFMTPEEIEAEVDKKIAQIQEARKNAKEKDAERKARKKEERDWKEYERLKEKYEGNGKEKENS